MQKKCNKNNHTLELLHSNAILPCLHAINVKIYTEIIKMHLLLAIQFSFHRNYMHTFFGLASITHFPFNFISKTTKERNSIIAMYT